MMRRNIALQVCVAIIVTLSNGALAPSPTQAARDRSPVRSAPVLRAHRITTKDDLQPYTIAVQHLSATIAGHLERHLRVMPTIHLNATEVLLKGEDGQYHAALAYAYPSPEGCHIFLNPSGQQQGRRDWTVTIAHEVFHCYQFEVQARRQPDWITEGQAEWVGEEVAGPDRQQEVNWWGTYITTPGKSLFQRTYDAIGFYAHLKESGVDPWRVFDAMLKTSSNEGAYHAAADQGGERFLDSWASGYFQEPLRGRPWETKGRVMTQATAHPGRVDLANGQGESLFASRFTNHIYRLVPRADIVQVSVIGHLRLSDQSLKDRVLPGGGIDFCTHSGGCPCPPGSTYQGPKLALLDGQAALALTGGPDGTRIHLHGESTDKFCKKKPVIRNAGALPDPCSLVTLGDALPLIQVMEAGFPIKTMGRGYANCQYWTRINPHLEPPPSVFVVGVWVLTPTVKEHLFAATTGCHPSPPHPIGGLGKGAFSCVGDPGSKGVPIHVGARHGRLWVVVSLGWTIRLPEEEGIVVATALVRKALSRF